MERKVLFLYGEEKQVAALPSLDTASCTDLSAMKSLVKTMFDALAHEDLTNVVLQVFDKDFEEWLDVNDSFVVEHKQKLKVVVRSSFKLPAKVQRTMIVL